MTKPSIDGAILQQYISSLSLRTFILESHVPVSPEQLRLIEKKFRAMAVFLPAIFPFKSSAVQHVQKIIREALNLTIDHTQAIQIYKDYRKIKRMRTSAQLAGRLGPRVASERPAKKQHMKKKEPVENYWNELNHLKQDGLKILNWVKTGFAEDNRQMLGNEIFRMTALLQKFSDHFSDDWATNHLIIPLKSFFLEELFPFCYEPSKEEFDGMLQKMNEILDRALQNLESRMIDGKYYDPESYRKHVMQNVNVSDMIEMASEKNSRVDLEDIYISSLELQEFLKHELQDMAYYAIVQAVKIAEGESSDQQNLDTILQEVYQNIQRFLSKASVNRDNEWDRDHIISPLKHFHLDLKKLCEEILEGNLDHVAEKTNAIYAFAEEVIEAVKEHSLLVLNNHIYLPPDDFLKASEKNHQ